MSLEKWGLEAGWTFCRIDEFQCSIICPQLKRGTTRDGTGEGENESSWREDQRQRKTTESQDRVHMRKGVFVEGKPENVWTANVSC